MKVYVPVFLALISAVVVISLAYIFVLCEECETVGYDENGGFSMTKNPVSSTDNKPPNTSINPDGGVFQVGEKINFSGGKTTDPD